MNDIQYHRAQTPTFFAENSACDGGSRRTAPRRAWRVRFAGSSMRGSTYNPGFLDLPLQLSHHSSLISSIDMKVCLFVDYHRLLPR